MKRIFSLIVVCLLVVPSSMMAAQAAQQFMQAVRAGNLRAVNRLIAKGADVNLQDENGYTPLMKAADQGHENIVRMLLAAPGIDVNLQNNNGKTALDFAVKKGHQNIAAMIRDVVPKKARSFMFAYKKSRETATSDPDPERQTRLGDLPPEIARLIAEQLLGKSSADRND